MLQINERLFQRDPFFKKFTRPKNLGETTTVREDLDRVVLTPGNNVWLAYAKYARKAPKMALVPASEVITFRSLDRYSYHLV